MSLAVCVTALHANPLAITEVMTSGSGSGSSQFPDWWELSNFGTNDISLAGYSWNDDSHGGFAGATNAPFVNGLVIHAHESIIFTETGGSVTDAASFRTWWGINNSVQVIVIGTGQGLGSGGDSVRLWSTNLPAMGTDTNGLDLNNAPEFLVDRVDTLASTKGFSQYYNTNNGLYGVNSAIGVDGAFKAATSADVGSPGVFQTNAAAIVIVSQPANQLVNVGGNASFQIDAYGLPKPRFQWLFNGVPADTNVAKIIFTVTNNYCRATLTITNVQVTNAGTFRVVIANGFQTNLVSTNATLTVNTAPFAPIFTQTPFTNLYVYPGQALTLSAAAFGSPPPTFQWQLNGTNIEGQTDSQYSFSISDTNQSGTYTVIATNSAGGTNASLVLNVTTKPNLRITEVMTSENPGGGHGDWWELSNLGTFPVNLLGFRFDDNSAFTGIVPFSQAYIIQNSVVIAPGESIVLAEDMTLAQFRTWWGDNQLPPKLQVIDYHGSGLGLSGTAGDAITLWNAAATSEGDFIDSVSVAAETNAISFGFNPDTQTFLGITPDGLSVLGVNGTVAAAVNGDIGSPGTIVNLPKITGLVQTNGTWQLSWISQPNHSYTVQYSTNLTSASWTTLTNFTAGDNTWNFADPSTNASRFYRVILNP